MVGKANGRKVNLLGTYVESPLVWAVAARTERDDVTSISELLGESPNSSSYQKTEILYFICNLFASMLLHQIPFNYNLELVLRMTQSIITDMT